MEKISGNGSYPYNCVDNNTVIFSEVETNRLLLALSGSGFVSAIFATLALLFALCKKVYKKFYYRLAVYQVVSSFFVSVTLVLLLVSYDYNIGHSQHWQVVGCKIAGFLLQYSLWVKLLFVTILTGYFFFFAILERDFKRFEVVYVIFCVVVPIIPSCIPFIHDSYGFSGAWCWIRVYENEQDECARKRYLEGIGYQFGIWYAPLFLSLSINAILAVIVLALLAFRFCTKKDNPHDLLLSQSGGSRQQNKRALNQLLPLLAYPIIFYIMTLLPLVNRIYGAINNEPSFSLAMAHAVIAGSWSFYSSAALLMHMFIMAKCMKKYERTVQADEGQYDDERQLFNTQNYEPYTEISTNAVTAFEPPNESTVDND